MLSLHFLITLKVNSSEHSCLVTFPQKTPWKNLGERESVPRHLMMLCTVATLHRSRHSIISCSLFILRVFPQAQPTTCSATFSQHGKLFLPNSPSSTDGWKTQLERGKKCAHDGSHRRHQFLALPTILLRKERREGKKLLIYQRRNKFT